MRVGRGKGQGRLMDAEEIKKRLKKRPITYETPQPKTYKLLQDEVDLIDDLTARYSRAKIKDTEIIRAAIRAFHRLAKEKGLEEIFQLPKLKPGRRAKEKSD